MKVAAIQHDITWEDPKGNFAHLAPMIAASAAAGARLAVMSEMYATGFSMAADRIAEPEGGPASSFLAEQAAAHDIWLYASIAEHPRAGGLPRNVGVLCAPDGTQHRYAKIHPFSYAGEHEVYGAGTDVVTVDVEGLRVSLFVCYDLRFADDFWMVAPQTDCYLVPANWPEPRRHAWRSLLVARAIENEAYVVGVNRVGEGDGLTYAGDSAVIDPLGETVATASGTEAILVADVDAAVVTSVRARFPFLRDRRTFPLR